MNKTLAVISAPVDTYSGYGARARDFIKALINCKPEWDIKILPQRWGNTKFGYLAHHNEKDLSSRLIQNLETKPKIWMQITVPNEFQKVGEYNIGVTAGIETTLCDISWIEGMNKMDLILTSSEHSKKVLSETIYDAVDNRTNEKISIKTTTPVEVLFEGVNLDLYKKPELGIDTQLVNSMNQIDESFCFLFVGHWLQGEHKQDRKNIGGLIETFLTTFKSQRVKPALILKTQSANSSITDRENILANISNIRNIVGNYNLPNIYLIHGELNDSEVNYIYNHSKVKAMACLTRGEGFGRPLLQFSTTGKPIIASGWSGHTDFLRGDCNYLVGGKLEDIHPSAVIEKLLLPQSKWFTFNEKQAKDSLKYVYKNYKKAINLGRKQKSITLKHYSFEKMQELLSDLINKYVPFFPVENTFVVPTPKKISLPKRPKK